MIKIGTRKSVMALAQTRQVIDQLRNVDPEINVEISEFKPLGDRDQKAKLIVHGGKGGAFVGEIRDAMRAGRLQAAMHSLKDMPGDEETPGLVIGAVLARDDAKDALVLRSDHTLDDFLATQGAGFHIGTNSVRRAAYLRRLYPQAIVTHFRGAVDTRLRKLDERTPQDLPDGGQTPPVDALVVAASGLARINQSNRIAKCFPAEEMLPAIGQGVVAVECAQSDWSTRAALAKIDCAATRLCVEAERELLWILNGHCNSPIAGLAERDGDTLRLRAAVLSLEGNEMITADQTGETAAPRALGRSVALELIKKGAAALIDKARI